MPKDPFTGRTVYGPDHEMNKAIRDATKRGTHSAPINPDWGKPKPKEKKDGSEGA